MKIMRIAILFVASWILATIPAFSQRSAPAKDAHIGYLYPAGGQRGTEFDVTIGGQNLTECSAVLFSGQGIEVEVVDYFKVFNRGEANRLRNRLDVVRQTLEERNEEGELVGPRAKQEDVEAKALAEDKVTQLELDGYKEYQRRRNDTKRQPNAQLEEWITARVRIAEDATLGKRFCRVQAKTGLSNPLTFLIDQLPEYREVEPNDLRPEKPIDRPLPLVINGQVMPGDVDLFRFTANRGDRLVVAVAARQLVPYLADAVPGWFQATLALYEPNGHEIAFVDDFEFHPDPVMFYKIPASGDYILEIRDSIYRGREDFVYRITVGEIPYLTGVYPLGRQSGQSVTLEPRGWNLPARSIEVEASEREPGVYTISMEGRKWVSNAIPFAVDLLPETMEQEPNSRGTEAQTVKPPVIINGRIDEPGDWDIFRFDGRAGGNVVLEVRARRLNSPVDSYLRIARPSGLPLAFNDDVEDKGYGLTTHHADSMIEVELPEDGPYFVYVGDRQNQGGPEYAYRLRISARQPDFALRVAPSTLNVRPGSSVPFEVFALRRDDFAGEIDLELLNAPEGITVRGNKIPEGEESAELVLSIPRSVKEQPLALHIEGEATIKEERVRRTAVPSDNWMQAFIYHHLVPADRLLLLATPRASVRKPKSAGGGTAGVETIQIAAGGFARYQVALPQLDNLDDIRVKVVQPAQGIEISRLVAGPGGLVMLLKADADLLNPGDEGDLVLEMTLNSKPTTAKTSPNGKTDPDKSKPVGSIPIVRYRISGG